MPLPEPPAAADQAPVISPCVGICRMSDDGTLCIGCHRTIDEIAAWSRATQEFKREVWRRLPARRAASGLGDA
jgi:predicted Fe-S protein YdhL (DUF1289 family)